MRVLAILTHSLTVTAFAAMAHAQTTSPTSVVSNGHDSHTVCITLPKDATINKADIFLLFDDTGSFAQLVPQVRSVFSSLVSSLQTSLPNVDLAFGVGRFEDYGGPQANTYFNVSANRSFVLNQAIVRAARPDFLTLVNQALARTAPGTGGTGFALASSLEALYQTATGSGFDGNLNGSTLDSGPAGSLAAQTDGNNSGDVPPFSSHVGVTDGSLGGVGWRPDAMHICILATDVVPVAAFLRADGIPASIGGLGGLALPTTAFCTTNTVPSADRRFGFVSNTLARTFPDISAPPGAHTVPATVAALNELGIRVIGLSPNGAPTLGTAPPGSPTSTSVWMSAMARLTGAVDSSGTPLVFNVSAGVSAIASAITLAVETTAALPIDITLTADPALPCLTVTASPATVTGVAPGGTACFDVAFAADTCFTGGLQTLNFRDVNGSGPLAGIPVTFALNQAPAIDCGVVLELWAPDHHLTDASGAIVVNDPDGDPLTVTVRCFSNEAETGQPGSGSGAHAPDFKDERAARGLLVRNERDGTGGGRFYVFFVTADDGQLSTSHACVAALCPHDKSTSMKVLGASAEAAAQAIEAALQNGQPLPAGIYEHGLATPRGPHQ